MNKLIAVLSRILMSHIFIISGFGKILGYAGTQAYMAHAGVPGFLLPLVILVEFGGGILLLIGFQARIVGFLLAGFTVLAALFFHNNFSDQMQMVNFMKNLSMAGGLLMYTLYGAGEVSVDSARSIKR